MDKNVCTSRDATAGRSDKPVEAATAAFIIRKKKLCAGGNGGGDIEFNPLIAVATDFVI